MHSEAAPGDSRKEYVRLGGIVAVGAIARFIFLGARSYWSDEIVSVKLATDNWGGFKFWLFRREANMALYYLLLRGWVHLGDGEAWVRLFSALFGVLSVPVLYLVAKRWFGERVAWIAALLAATNACMVEFSQEARSYSLLMLLVALSYFFFDKMLREKRRWPAAAYVIFSAAALYAHFFAGLIACAQFASLAWFAPERLRRVRVFVAYLAIAIAATPIEIYILRNDVGQLYWVRPATVAEVYKLLIFFAGGSKAVAAVLSVVSVATCGAAVARSHGLLRIRSEQSWKVAAVITWTVLPPLIAVLVSLHKPIFVHRYLLICLPGYVLLIALGLGRLKKAALGAVLCLFVVLSGVSIAQGYFRPIEDWRNAVAYVLQNTRPEDALVEYIPYGANNFNFYAQRLERTIKHPPFKYLDGSQVPQPESLIAPRTWLILYPSPHTAELAPQFESMLASRYERLERCDFKGVSVLLFSELKPLPSRPQAESIPRR